MRGKQIGANGTAGDIVWGGVPDVQMRGGDGGPLAGRPIGQEYDGLESGELAWIMGRKFLSDPTSQDGATLADGSVPWRAVSQSAHALGAGYGPDRMQRLAYTSWMEAYFRALFGNRPIMLNNISLSGPKQVYMSDDLKKYAPYLKGASVLGSVDLPHVLNGIYSANPTALKYTGTYNRETPYKKDDNPREPPVTGQRDAPAKEGLSSGLLVVEKGPFLRGKIVNDDAVDMLAPELSAPNSGQDIFHSVPRNMGDRLAFDALYSEMRAANFFDWSPDGMVLSKLESPSGEPLSSAELDARQAQLFNVCIQGPAIAKTWTGDPKMQCMPLDRVFIVMVADISSVIAGKDKGIGAGAALPAAWTKYGEWVRPPTGGPSRAKAGKPGVDAELEKATKAFEDAKVNVGEAGGYGLYAKAVGELFKAQAASVGSGSDGDRSAARAAVANARATMDTFFDKLQDDYDEAVSGACKQGTIGFETSTMTNFRLMRVTSSYLAATSACVVGENGKVDPKSRCGLRLGQKTDDAKTVTGEYIIGGWCIGTVIDSAASRASIGNMVRTAPASMAININVNVEWWSGDDLYKRYMDVDRTVQQRGQMAALDEKTNPTKLVQAREAKFDVPMADLEEALPWVPFRRK